MPPDRTDLAQRARDVISPVLGHYTWLPVERGEGSWLYAKDGRRYLDLTCGIAVLAIGHSHPKVVAAIEAQARKLLHISAGVAVYEANVAYAEALVKVAPEGLDTVYFCNSGAEAVESAIKFARQVTRRTAVIGFRGGFHGRTTGATALTTSKAVYKEGYGPLLPDVHIAPFPYSRTCGVDAPHTPDECAAHCLAELERMLEHEVPPKNVAACIVEPVLGEGGYVPAPAAFLRGLRDLTRKHGIFLVFDEIQTGLGRTGALFAAQRYGVTPDVLLLAKALGGGLPLGALLAPRELHERWLTGTHASTFGGNPVSCAAGLATLGVILEEGLTRRAEMVGQVIVEELRPISSQRGVAEVRHFGAMVAVELVDARGAPDKGAAKAAIAAALERGVLIITCGSHDEVIRFIPALNIAEEDLRKGVRTLVEVIRKPAAAAAR